MIVRAVDGNGDWRFGRGKNDYLTKVNALAQNISTRLQSYKYDCFFDKQSGVDWFNFLGGKNMLALRLAIGTIILGTPNVTGLKELTVTIDSTRQISISYSVTTAFSAVSTIQSVSSTVSVLVNGLTF